MSVTIKTPEEIEKMRMAGRLAAEVLEMIKPYVVPGVTTDELNQICHDYMVGVQQVIPAPLNYKGFPKSICTSVNHQVCHGIPGPKKLKSGDIVNVDITVIKDGYHGDTSQMFMLGEVSPKARRLVKVCLESLYHGIERVPRCPARRHRPCHTASCRVQRLLGGTGVLRAWHRAGVSRRATGSALW